MPGTFIIEYKYEFTNWFIPWPYPISVYVINKLRRIPKPNKNSKQRPSKTNDLIFLCFPASQESEKAEIILTVLLNVQLLWAAEQLTQPSPSCKRLVSQALHHHIHTLSLNELRLFGSQKLPFLAMLRCSQDLNQLKTVEQ